MAILILNDREPLNEHLIAKIADDYVLYQKIPSRFDLNEALDANRNIDLLVSTYNDLSAKQLGKLKRLRAIVLTTTAYEYVDLDYCREQGIKVFNNRGYSQTAVAEHLMSLMLAAARRIPLLDSQLRQGDFNQFNQPGFELNGKTLGIVGMGHIGAAFAHLCSGFGMTITFYNRTAKDCGYTQLSLDELLSTSDVLALTIALNNESKSLLDQAAFDKMKANNILVSISADEVVDQCCLVRAITNGKMFAAGLDLHHPIPELYQLPQVVLTPTKAWYTAECMQRRTSSWVKILNDLLRGQESNRVI